MDSFEGQIADGEKVTGFANLRMRMDLEDVPKLLNYFANNAPTLTRDGVIGIIADEESKSRHSFSSILRKCSGTKKRIIP